MCIAFEIQQILVRHACQLFWIDRCRVLIGPPRFAVAHEPPRHPICCPGRAPRTTRERARSARRCIGCTPRNTRSYHVPCPPLHRRLPAGASFSAPSLASKVCLPPLPRPFVRLFTAPCPVVACPRPRPATASLPHLPRTRPTLTTSRSASPPRKCTPRGLAASGPKLPRQSRGLSTRCWRGPFATARHPRWHLGAQAPSSPLLLSAVAAAMGRRWRRCSGYSPPRMRRAV